MADDDDRWTVRGVPKAYQVNAGEAARRRKVSLGVHVCQALDLAAQAERQPFDLALPRGAADAVADVSAGLSVAGQRLELIERAIGASVALAAAPDVPRAFRRRAMRLLREGLPVSVPFLAAPEAALEGAPGASALGGEGPALLAVPGPAPAFGGHLNGAAKGV